MKLHPKLMDLSLGRVHRLLARLGNPERQLPPVVHVTGTNGKGSMLAYLRAMLEDAGYAVHVYTSPHLVRFNERIRLAGEPIDEDRLVAVLEECEKANHDEQITFFEITTVAALLEFSRRPADIVLLENGLGGRLDATNVVDRPLLTAITPVSLDHQQFLGDTLGKIAFEKAGILKPGVSCVVGPQEPEAFDVVAARADAVGAPLVAYGRDWTVEGENLPAAPALPGAHQLLNAAMAVVAARHLDGFRVSAGNVKAGLAGIEWPARIQRLTAGPLAGLLPDGWELWLDGGHNKAAGETLAAHARAAWGDRPLHLIAGMLNSKSAVDFLRPLAGVAEGLRSVAIPGEANTFTAEELAAAGRAAGFDDPIPAGSVDEALAGIVGARGGPARVMICGSLYLAGTVLADNG